MDEREAEPVVLVGADTPKLLGLPPDQVVAFTWYEGWEQVPVQVDERKMVDFATVRQLAVDPENGFRALAYADPDTWAEADGVAQTVATPEDPGSGPEIPGTSGDPMLDGNDEIAVMAYDAGWPAGDRTPPEGVDPSTRTSIRVTDPLDPGNHAYLYLFRSTSGHDPAGDYDLVGYERNFSPKLPGGYRLGYNFEGTGNEASGPVANPERSAVYTARYDVAMRSRWNINRLVIAASEGPDVDILDSDKLTFGETGCFRNDLTINRGGGGLIADIDGPVRTIRSSIGANEGTFSQRDYLYYEGFVETRTYLRGHPGSGPVISAFDLSSNALGMTYRNGLNPEGVRVDGAPDQLTSGPYDWEQFSGDQGSVTNVSRLAGDADGITQSSFYQDMALPPEDSPMLCSGDNHSYGAAGPAFDAPDGDLEFSRYSWFDGPEADAALGRLRSEQVDNPIETAVGAVEPAVLVVKATPSRLTLRPGTRRTIRVTVRNLGRKQARGVSVCTRKARWNQARARCRKAGRINQGKAMTRRITLKAGKQAGRGARTLKIRAKANKAFSYGGMIRVRIKG